MPFKPGQSGNPGGRPKGKGLALAVRAKAGDDGEHLVSAWWELATAKSDAIKKKYGAAPTVRDRLTALQELADRGFGKAPQTVAGDPDNPVTVRVVFGGRYRPTGEAA